MSTDQVLGDALGALLDDATQLSEITQPTPHEEVAADISLADNASSTASSSSLWTLLGMAPGKVANSGPTPRKRRKAGTQLSTAETQLVSDTEEAGAMMVTASEPSSEAIPLVVKKSPKKSPKAPAAPKKSPKTSDKATKPSKPKARAKKAPKAAVAAAVDIASVPMTAALTAVVASTDVATEIAPVATADRAGTAVVPHVVINDGEAHCAKCKCVLDPSRTYGKSPPTLQFLQREDGAAE